MSQWGRGAVTRRTGQISTRNFVDLPAQGRAQKCKPGRRACRAVQEPAGEALEFGARRGAPAAQPPAGQPGLASSSALEGIGSPMSLRAIASRSAEEAL
jgi:hypothetical protein